MCTCVCLQAFYKGFVPNFARLGSWNVAMFLMLEQVRNTIAGGKQVCSIITNLMLLGGAAIGWCVCHCQHTLPHAAVPNIVVDLLCFVFCR